MKTRPALAGEGTGPRDRIDGAGGVAVVFQLRRSLAALLRTPGFSAVVLMLVGVAVAALLTIGAAASALLWRPLPFPQGERLMLVQGHSSKMGATLGFAPGLLADLAAMPEVDAVGGYDHARPLFDAQGGEFRNARVEPGLFALLGATPLLGRLPIADDGDDVVLLSEPTWRSRFGADPEVVGRALDFDGTRLRVLGVLPAAFRFPERETALWRPLRFAPEQLSGARAFDFGAVQPLVRLAPGVSEATFRSALQARIAVRPELQPMRQFMGLELRAVSLREQWEGGRGELLGLLGAAAAAVLLLLVANVASLWLTRCLRRGRELAVRSALGASGRRLAFELVLEVFVLIGAAVLLGLLAVPPGLRALEAIGVLDGATPVLPALDAGTLALAAGVALALTGLLALVPVWLVRRPQAQALLAQGMRGTAGRGAQRARRVLVALQLALAVSLVCGAGLLVRSLWQLLDQDPGFQPQGVSLLVIEDRLAGEGDVAATATRIETLRQRMQGLPGVSVVSFSNAPPFSFNESVSSVTMGAGSASRDATVRARAVGPDYFEALGIPLRAGRGFVAADAASAEPSLVVDAHFAALHLGADPAIGARVGMPQDAGRGAPRWGRVVGVVPTVRHLQLGEQPELGTVYQFAARPEYEAGRLMLVVRSSLPIEALASAARDAAREVGLRVVESATLVQRMRETLSDRLPLLGLVGAFAALGALLAASGLFALVAFAVQRRTAEFGLRLALGAPPASLRGLALREGWSAAAPGLVLGLLGALAVGRLLAARLYQVEPWDPFTLAAVLSGAAAVVLLAGLGPARRAAALDPASTLRHD
jgi:putative ABC transport system permease protein